MCFCGLCWISVRIQRNGLTRSRRSHFSHGDTSMDSSKDMSTKSQQPEVRISYEKDRLLYFAKSIFAWELPREWATICELYPNIVRNKVRDDGAVKRNANDCMNNNTSDHNRMRGTNKGVLQRAATIGS